MQAWQFLARAVGSPRTPRYWLASGRQKLCLHLGSGHIRCSKAPRAHHGHLAVQAVEALLYEALVVLARQKRHRVLLVLAQRQDVLRRAPVCRPPARRVWGSCKSSRLDLVSAQGFAVFGGFLEAAGLSTLSAHWARSLHQIWWHTPKQKVRREIIATATCLCGHAGMSIAPLARGCI